MLIKFKKLDQKAMIPRYAYPDDAGFDVFSLEGYLLQPGEVHQFHTGLASEIYPGYCVIFKPKSGLAVKAGIDLMAGVIDSSYRGEWIVVLINLSKNPYQINIGDKICQGLVFNIGPVQIVEASELFPSVRGQAGFGSSGK